MSLRLKLREIIFGTDTPAGRAFDIGLLVTVLASVVIVMMESVVGIETRYGAGLRALEWFFTALFTVEYLLRLYCAPRPIAYARSFYGVVDLVAIAPTYVGILLPGGHYLMTVRVLRLLRVFRIFKLATYVEEAKVLLAALQASGRRVIVFLLAVLTMVVMLGSLMYMVETAEAGFTSIPRSIYWAVVTLTTVGYGDISPRTGLGQALAAVIMILGYSMIVIPTGFVSVAVAEAAAAKPAVSTCSRCGGAGHDGDARFCKFCGEALAADG